MSNNDMMVDSRPVQQHVWSQMPFGEGIAASRVLPAGGGGTTGENPSGDGLTIADGSANMTGGNLRLI